MNNENIIDVMSRVEQSIDTFSLSSIFDTVTYIQHHR